MDIATRRGLVCRSFPVLPCGSQKTSSIMQSSAHQPPTTTVRLVLVEPVALEQVMVMV